MKKSFRPTIFVLVVALFALLAKAYHASPVAWQPQIKLVGFSNLPGSFVSPQVIYADSERIFAGSFQGDLFILERDRAANFPLIQTLHFGSPLSAVRGDETHVYVAGRDGNLYILSKTWPIQLVQSMSLSSYGLNSLDIEDRSLYVAKGQATMTVADDRVYL